MECVLKKGIRFKIKGCEALERDERERRWGRPPLPRKIVYVAQPRYAMQVITVHFPKPWLEEMNYYVANTEFPNRSELVRFAVKMLLMELRTYYDGEKNNPKNKNTKKTNINERKG